MDIISLLGLPFIVALEMTVILGYVGIHVLKREIIFIDISMAQVAAVGAIAAHLAFEAHSDSVVGYASAFGATLIVAGFYSLVRRWDIGIPLEAVIGVTYAIAAALALFLVGVSPGGHLHIHQMLAGSILWATPKDVLLCGVVFAIVGLCFYIFRKPFAKISDDYEGAVRQGMKTALWDFIFYALVGIIITIAVRIAGVIVVFTFLIIPATLSAVFSDNWNKRLIITWVTGAAAAGIGLLFADAFDFSVGPSIAFFLGIALVFAALLRLMRVTKTATAVSSLVAAVVLFVWFLLSSGYSNLSAEDPNTIHNCCLPLPTIQKEDEIKREEIVDASQVALISNTAKLVEIFNNSDDVEIRTTVVSHLLEINQKKGIQLALEFLKTDPPLLFRQGVVNKIKKSTSKITDYNIEESFNSTNNQRIIKMLLKQ